MAVQLHPAEAVHLQLGILNMVQSGILASPAPVGQEPAAAPAAAAAVLPRAAVADDAALLDATIDERIHGLVAFWVRALHARLELSLKLYELLLLAS
jgi:hypothetical protein